MINLCADRKSFCSFMIFFSSSPTNKTVLFSLSRSFCFLGRNICSTHFKKLRQKKNISNRLFNYDVLSIPSRRRRRRKKKAKCTYPTSLLYARNEMKEKANLQISQKGYFGHELTFHREREKIPIRISEYNSKSNCWFLLKCFLNIVVFHCCRHKNEFMYVIRLLLMSHSGWWLEIKGL